MKAQWMIIISLLTFTFTGCANNTNHHKPDLQSFQGRTLPTESAQAAQVANTM